MTDSVLWAAEQSPTKDIQDRFFDRHHALLRLKYAQFVECKFRVAGILLAQRFGRPARTPAVPVAPTRTPPPAALPDPAAAGW
jgi:hypothetical protein